jgi:Cu/Zn superoxide dismutase
MLGRITTIALCVIVVALAFSGTARSDVADDAAPTVAFALKARHGSGTTGTATLTSLPAGVRVVLKVKTQFRGSLPAHIHTGRCRPEPTPANPRISNTLKNVVRGKSVTTVAGASLEDLRAKPFSINVHSTNYGIISCGNIPRA